MIGIILAILIPLAFTDCPKSFQNRCHCGMVRFPSVDSSLKYVVNCTNTHFENAKPLEDLPDQTEALIFTGNHLEELDFNIFGVNTKTYDDLTYIDMSHNHISFIKGKTFHKVSSVETLILNYNDISITGKHNRPRIFSNFESLKNLHMTDAFTDIYNASSYYLLSLEDVFDESELTELQKLHLEQNEIWSIGSNESIFCSLTNLQHIYLADNKLSDMDFKIDCMENLNYIDLRFNSISRLSEDSMMRLSAYSNKPKKIRIDLKDNPFNCDCMAKNFIDWLKSTKVILREADKYICREGYPRKNVNLQLQKVEDVSCPQTVVYNGYSSGTVAFLSFVIIFMIVVGAIFTYYHKKRISTVMEPILDEFTKRMGYSGLAKDETAQEAHI